MKYISLFADYAPNSLDVADLYFIMHQKNTGNDKMPSKIDKNKAKYVNQIVLTKKESLRDGSISRASTDLDTISSFKAQIEDNEDFSLKGIFIDLTGNKCSKETVKNFVTFLSTNKKLKHDTVERFFRTLIPSIKHTEAGTFKVVEREG